MADRFFAHYRYQLVLKLAASDEFAFWFAADWGNTRTHSVDSGIQGLQAEPSRLHDLPLLRLGRVEWQRGLAASVWRKEYSTYVVTGDWKIASSWIAALVGRLRGTPVLFWTHGWLDCDGRAKYLLRQLFYRASAGLLLYGTKARDIALQQGFDPDHIHVMFNSLDSRSTLLSRLTAMQDEVASRGDRSHVQVVLVSRLIAERRIHVLFKAAQLLSMRGLDVRITLVGDGPEMNALKSFVRNANPPIRVTFAGAIHDAKTLEEVYEDADICVLPGRAGLAVLQSLAHGVPVLIVSGSGCSMPETEAIIPGLNGCIASGEGEAEVARAIEAMLSADLTRIKAGRACVESLMGKYCAEDQAERIVEAIRGSLHLQ